MLAHRGRKHLPGSIGVLFPSTAHLEASTLDVECTKLSLLFQDPSGGEISVSFAHLGNMPRKGVRLGKVTYGGAVPVVLA